MKNEKSQDQKLFDKIAKKYAAKDLYPVSRTARKFQVITLLDLLCSEKTKSRFKSIIEIGCGSGANSEYLEGYYEKYTGMDYSGELIKIAKHFYGKDNTDFFQSDIKDIGKERKYDLILCVGVLHHLPDLNEYLFKIKETGNEDSVYLFLEPLAENPFIQLLRFMRKKIDPAYSSSQVFFKKTELYKAFEETGFQITQIKYTGYFTPPFAQVIIRPSFIFNPLVKFLTKLDKIIQNKFPNRLSWNISFAARKIK